VEKLDKDDVIDLQDINEETFLLKSYQMVSEQE
jgi:hypothetical protein